MTDQSWRLALNRLIEQKEQKRAKVVKRAKEQRIDKTEFEKFKNSVEDAGQGLYEAMEFAKRADQQIRRTHPGLASALAAQESQLKAAFSKVQMVYNRLMELERTIDRISKGLG